MKNLFCSAAIGVAFALTACTTATPAAAATNPSPLADVVNDGRIDEELAGKGEALLKGNTGLAISNLIDQLSRRSCSLSLPALETKTRNSQELYARARESVVVMGGLFKCKRCTNWHVNTATGFAVAEPDVFMTNYHVIKDTNAAILVARSWRGKVAAVAEVLAADPTADFALVRIPGLALPPLPLRGSAPAGSPIALVSHPDHRFFSFATGYISRYFQHARQRHTTPVEWLQVTAEFAKGSSGAPVLDECGNAVGMVASTQAVYYNEHDAMTAQMVFRDCVPMRTVLKALRPADAR